MSFTRNNYEIIESFEAENGRTYAKVRWKGIGQEGYISRLGGPGNTITKSWYREKKRENEDGGIDGPPKMVLYRRTAILENGEYSPNGTEWELEVWKARFNSRISEQEIREDLYEAFSYAAVEIPMLSRGDATEKIGGLTKPERARPQDTPLDEWHGVIRIKGKAYTIEGPGDLKRR